MEKTLITYWRDYLSQAVPSIFNKQLTRLERLFVASLLAVLNIQAQRKSSWPDSLGQLIIEAKESESQVWSVLNSYLSYEFLSHSTYSLANSHDTDLSTFCSELVRIFNSYLVGRDIYRRNPCGAKFFANVICLDKIPQSCLVWGEGGLELAYELGCKGVEVIVETKSAQAPILIQILSGLKDISLVPYSDWDGTKKIDRAFFVPDFLSRGALFDEEEKKLIHYVQGEFFSLCSPLFMSRTISQDVKERETLIQLYGLDKVIYLPVGAWEDVAISLGLLCFSHSLKKIDVVTFIDLPELPSPALPRSSQSWENKCLHILEEKNDKERISKVAVAQLADKGWVLAQHSYIDSPELKAFKEFIDSLKTPEKNSLSKHQQPFKIKPLSAEFEIIRCQSLSRFIPEEYLEQGKPLPGTEPIYEFRLSNIGSTGEILSEDINPIFAPKGEIKKQMTKQELQTGDILLNVLGGMSKIAFVRSGPEKRLIANQSIVILRSKSSNNRIDNGLFLYFFLLNNVVRSFLYRKRNPMSFRASLISIKELSEMPIPVPTNECLASVEKVFKRTSEIEQQISLLQQEKEDLINNFFLHSNNRK